MRIQACIILIATSLYLSAQETELPRDVQAAFKSKYPDQPIDSWNAGDGQYSLDFYRGGTMFTAVFKEDGTWMETAEIISDMDLPATVQDYIKKNYAQGSISYSERVERNDKSRFLRINLDFKDASYIIQSNLDGTNISARKAGTDT